MNKSELINSLYESNQKDFASHAAAERAVNHVFNKIKETLQNGENVSLDRFGSFTIVRHAARTAVNPNTGKKIQVESKKRVKFSPSSSLKQIAQDSMADV